MMQHDHPFWECLKILCWGVCIIAGLWVCATNFDRTEIQAWSIALGGGSAATVGINALKNVGGKKNAD